MYVVMLPIPRADLYDDYVYFDIFPRVAGIITEHYACIISPRFRGKFHVTFAISSGGGQLSRHYIKYNVIPQETSLQDNFRNRESYTLNLYKMTSKNTYNDQPAIASEQGNASISQCCCL
jgi:hypothetical protein